MNRCQNHLTDGAFLRAKAKIALQIFGYLISYCVSRKLLAVSAIYLRSAMGKTFNIKTDLIENLGERLPLVA
jgi:hypothetical protein